MQSNSSPLKEPAEGSTVDEATFRQIYEENVRWVWHALRRFSVAEKDVMDAAQNVFLVVHRKLPEFEGRSRVRTWILQIVRRVASDYRRSAPVRREVVTDAPEFDPRSVRPPTAEDDAVRAQRVDLARQILDRLPEAQRTVFVMFELEQMSGQEIADELGIPVGTVRSRLRLARGTFQQEVAALAGHQPMLEVIHV